MRSGRTGHSRRNSSTKLCTGALLPCTNVDRQVFFSMVRLGSIQTEVLRGAGPRWSTVAVHDLWQGFPDPETDPDVPDLPDDGDSEPKLALYHVLQRPGGDYQHWGLGVMQAEDRDTTSGAPISASLSKDYDSSKYVNMLDAGDQFGFQDVNLGTGANRISVRYWATNLPGQSLKLRVDSATAAYHTSIPIPANPYTFEGWATTVVNLSSPLSGVHDIYLTTPADIDLRINWIQFGVASPYAQESLPATSFWTSAYKWDWHPNRVQYGGGVVAQWIPRIKGMVTPLGGTVEVTYGQPQPCGGTFYGSVGGIVPDYAPDLSQNDTNCFPSWFVADPENPGGAAALIDWNKWVVTQTVRRDAAYPTTPRVESYEYFGPAWAFGEYPNLDSTTTSGDCQVQTWEESRGFAEVRVTQGSTQTSRHFFFQGMDGDLTSNAQPVDMVTDAVTQRCGKTLERDLSKTYSLAAAPFSVEDKFWLRGREYQMRSPGTGANRVHSWTVYTNDVTAGTGMRAARLVPVSETGSTTYGPSGAKSVRTTYSYDPYGNQTDVYSYGEWDFVNGVNVANDNYRIQRAFALNATKWITGLVKTERLWSSQTSPPISDLVTATDYLYDNNAINDAPTLGRLTSTVRYTSIGLTSPTGGLTTTYDYNTRGKLTATAPPSGPRSIQRYDTIHGYVDQTWQDRGTESPAVLNPDELVTTLTYDTLTHPLTVTDTRGRTTRTVYDEYGRLSEVFRPGDNYHASGINPTDQTPNQPSTSFEYYPGLRPAVTVTKQRHTGFTGPANPNDPGVARTWEFYDGFGNVAQTQRQSPFVYDNNGTDVYYNAQVTWQTIDNQGRVANRSSSPIDTIFGLGNYQVPDWATAPSYESIVYDAFSRPTTVGHYEYPNLNPIWTTTTSYDIWTTTVTDPTGDVTHTDLDSAGNVSRVREVNGASTYTTTYDYDDANRLTNVTDPAGKVTTIGYDRAGRKLTLNDPNTGAWSYTYNGIDQLVTQTRPNGTNSTQVLWFGYDTLGRNTELRAGSTNTGTLLRDFTYGPNGTTENLVTNARARTPDGTYVESRSVAFDIRDRVTQSDLVIPTAGTYRTNYTYNRADQLSSVQYPADASQGAGETVYYQYNAVTGLPAGMSGAFGYQYVSNVRRYISNIYGVKVETLTHGPAANPDAQRDRQYSLRTDRLIWLRGGIGTNIDGIQRVNYSYFNDGTVQSIKEENNGGAGLHLTTCYDYDGLDRLTDAWSINPASQTCPGTIATHAYNSTYGTGRFDDAYTYSSAGNLLTHTRSSPTDNRNWTYTYPTASNVPGDSIGGPNAVSSISNGGPSYTYSASGQPMTRTAGTVTQTLSYDQFEQLTGLTDGTTTTAYWYDAYGTRVYQKVGSTVTTYVGGLVEWIGPYQRKYYTFDGQLIRMTNVVDGIWLFADAQGSASFGYNTTTATTFKQRYYPYGQLKAAAALPTTIGYTGQRLDTSGLMYYQSRYYDPLIGRFAQPDSIVPGGRGQDLNRYTYVNSSPVNYTDPSGHAGCNDYYGRCQGSVAGDAGAGDSPGRPPSPTTPARNPYPDVLIDDYCGNCLSGGYWPNTTLVRATALGDELLLGRCSVGASGVDRGTCETTRADFLRYSPLRGDLVSVLRGSEIPWRLYIKPSDSVAFYPLPGDILYSYTTVSARALVYRETSLQIGRATGESGNSSLAGLSVSLVVSEVTYIEETQLHGAGTLDLYSGDFPGLPLQTSTTWEVQRDVLSTSPLSSFASAVWIPQANRDSLVPVG